MTQHVVRYVDGCGNVYTFMLDNGIFRMDYEPMKPEWSSSGEYDGGEPRSAVLSAEDSQELEQFVVDLRDDPSKHVTSRNMGTGLFSVHLGLDDAPVTFIVARDVLRDWEEFVRGL
jgi:hypothetical protein